jgi:hypothetical protein
LCQEHTELPTKSFLVEPISKFPEQDNTASELHEAKEVMGVVFHADDKASLPRTPVHREAAFRFFKKLEWSGIA